MPHLCNLDACANDYVPFVVCPQVRQTRHRDWPITRMPPNTAYRLPPPKPADVSQPTGQTHRQPESCHTQNPITLTEPRGVLVFQRGTDYRHVGEGQAGPSRTEGQAILKRGTRDPAAASSVEGLAFAIVVDRLTAPPALLSRPLDTQKRRRLGDKPTWPWDRRPFCLPIPSR